MRTAEERTERWRERFLEERDRRYSEVATEREKALAIKERADTDARILVAENQAYRDEKGNELRSQIERERGDYPTRAELAAAVAKIEVTLKPLADYVTAQQGGPRAITGTTIAAFLAAGALLVGVYLGLRDSSQPAAPTVTVTVPSK